jgi:hypothetical protein
MLFQAFAEHDRATLDRCFGCVIGNYIEIINHNGDKDFKTPHFGIRKRQRDDIEDLCTLHVDQELIDKCKSEIKRLNYHHP